MNRRTENTEEGYCAERTSPIGPRHSSGVSAAAAAHADSTRTCAARADSQEGDLGVVRQPGQEEKQPVSRDS